MDIMHYLKTLDGKRIAIIGIGVSNTPLARLILRTGARVTIHDKRSRAEIGEAAVELESLGAELVLGAGYLDDLRADIIFRTPGMYPNNPALHRARSEGAQITSEMEVFFKVCPCKIIGVTGSDGKTTTTTIIHDMLKAAGYSAYIGGNIGTPLLSLAGNMLPKEYAVLELSSFQLMTMTQSPDIAVMTNITPNHLDYHKSMEEYVEAKENIYRHQNKNGLLVLNADNDLTRSFREKAKGHVSMFSAQRKQEQGIYLRHDGMICRTGSSIETEVMDSEEILMRGGHNVENYMAAIAAVSGLVPDEIMLGVAKTLRPVEHRIELVRVLRGVEYYNDSIASSPARTIAGLNSFDKKVILIAGGYDKNIPYDELGKPILEHVKTLVLTGDTADKIETAVRNANGYSKSGINIMRIPDFTAAVKAAAKEAVSGDVVILSPASASFDRFKDFAERGETFKRIVYELN